MPSSDDYFNEVVEIEGDHYLVQDGELLEEPLARPIDELLECERNDVQVMLENQEDYDGEISE